MQNSITELPLVMESTRYTLAALAFADSCSYPMPVRVIMVEEAFEVVFEPLAVVVFGIVNEGIK